MFNKNTQQKGFTLVELLVVIAIIGLLSTLSIVALNSARTKARDGARIASVKQWQTALELYYSDNNGYPKNASSSAGIRLGDKGVTYFGKLPQSQAPWTGGSCTPNSQEFSYAATDNGGTAQASDSNTTYQITYCLENGAGTVLAGWHTATPMGIQ